MKYLCLGYGDPAKMDALPKEELSKMLRRCVPYVEELNTYEGIIVHEAVSWDATTIRTVQGKRVVTDGPFVETREKIGSFFVIEARDLNEAIQVASRHPSANMGEELGWRIEVRPVVEFRPD